MTAKYASKLTISTGVLNSALTSAINKLVIFNVNYSDSQIQLLRSANFQFLFMLGYKYYCVSQIAVALALSTNFKK